MTRGVGTLVGKLRNALQRLPELGALKKRAASYSVPSDWTDSGIAATDSPFRPGTGAGMLRSSRT
jgi:hypothetical protein